MTVSVRTLPAWLEPALPFWRRPCGANGLLAVIDATAEPSPGEEVVAGDDTERRAPPRRAGGQPGTRRNRSAPSPGSDPIRSPPRRNPVGQRRCGPGTPHRRHRARHRGPVGAHPPSDQRAVCRWRRRCRQGGVGADPPGRGTGLEPRPAGQPGIRRGQPARPAGLVPRHPQRPPPANRGRVASGEGSARTTPVDPVRVPASRSRPSAADHGHSPGPGAPIRRPATEPFR